MVLKPKGYNRVTEKANQLWKQEPMGTSGKFREKENKKEKTCSKSQNNYDKQKLFWKFLEQFFSNCQLIV